MPDIIVLLILFILAVVSIIAYWKIGTRPTEHTGPQFKIRAQTGGESEVAVAAAVCGGPESSQNLGNATFDTEALTGGRTKTAFATNFLPTSLLDRLLHNSSPSTDSKVIQTYKMDAVPRGICLIINNTRFADGIPNRWSSEILTAQLKKLFTTFRFTTMDFTNKTANQMMELIKFQARKNHSSHDAFICFVLSHGNKGTLHGCDGQKVDLLDFINTMNPENCRSLDGKPKLFFIEACRTENKVEDKDISDIMDKMKKLSESLSGPRTVLEDFFVGYSTLLYDRSYKNNESGDLYTQEFINVMNEFGKSEDLLSIMTEVNRRVSEREIYGNDGRLKQFPDMCSRLRRKFFF